MSTILNKTVSFILLIMMLFSVAFNVLSYDYKVFGNTNADGWAEIGFYNNNIKCDFEAYMAIQPIGESKQGIETNGSFNVAKADDKGYVGSIFVTVKPNTTVYPVEYSNSYVDIREKETSNNVKEFRIYLKSSYKYSEGQEFSYKMKFEDNTPGIGTYKTGISAASYRVHLTFNATGAGNDIQYSITEYDKDGKSTGKTYGEKSTDIKIIKNGYGIIGFNQTNYEMELKGGNSGNVSVEKLDTRYKIKAVSTPGESITLKAYRYGKEIATKYIYIGVYEGGEDKINITKITFHGNVTENNKYDWGNTTDKTAKVDIEYNMLTSDVSTRISLNGFLSQDITLTKNSNIKTGIALIKNENNKPNAYENITFSNVTSQVECKVNFINISSVQPEILIGNSKSTVKYTATLKFGIKHWASTNKDISDIKITGNGVTVSNVEKVGEVEDAIQWFTCTLFKQVTVETKEDITIEFKGAQKTASVTFKPVNDGGDKKGGTGWLQTTDETAAKNDLQTRFPNVVIQKVFGTFKGDNETTNIYVANGSGNGTLECMVCRWKGKLDAAHGGYTVVNPNDMVKVNLSDESKAVLAYLGYRADKYNEWGKLQQYVHSKTSWNDGDPTSFRDEQYKQYIVSINKVGNQTIATIEVDKSTGETIECVLDDVVMMESSNWIAIKNGVDYSDSAIQPFMYIITNYRPGSTTIKIRKEDASGNKLGGAKFDVTVGGQTFECTSDENNNGYLVNNNTKKPLTLEKNLTYEIKEKNSPDDSKYDKTDETAIITVSSDGKSISNFTIKNGEGKEISIQDSKFWDWKNGELIVKIKNYGKPGGPELFKKAEDGTPLNGVVFNIKSSTNSIEQRTTKDGGKIDLSDLEDGKYTISEESTLEGYKLSTQYAVVTISGGKITSCEVYDADNSCIKDGKVDITKELTGKLATNKDWEWAQGSLQLKVTNKKTMGPPKLFKVKEDDTPIPGAEFIIYCWDDKDKQWKFYIPTSQKDSTFKPDENGVELPNFEAGKTYLIVETKAPDDYTPSTQYAIVTVENEKINYKIYQAKEDEIKQDGEDAGYIKVTKTNLQGDGAPIESSEWKVEEEGLVLKVINRRPGKLYKLNEYNQTMKDTEIKFSIIHDDGTSEDKIGVDSEGGIDLSTLKDGTHTIIEKATNPKYKISTQYAVIEVENGKIINCKIYQADEACIEKVQTKRPIVVERVNNNPSGSEASVKEWDWNEDALILTLKNEPEGFHPPTPSTPSTPDVPNEKILRIKKVSSSDGKSIEGVKFKIRKVGEATAYDEYTTDGNGDIILKANCYSGLYKLTEAFTPSEYEPTNQYIMFEINKQGAIVKDTVEVIENGDKDEDGYQTGYYGSVADKKLDWSVEDENGQIVLTLKNKKKTDEDEPDVPRIRIKKTDTEGKPIDDLVTFDIYSSETCEAHEYVGTISTFNGQSNTVEIRMPSKDPQNLVKGYYIKEDQHPIIYKELEEPIHIWLSWDESGNNIICERVTKNEDGSISVDTTGVEVDGNLITISIVNEIDTSRLRDDVKIPLLMYIKGKVWLDQAEGKGAEANGYYNEGDTALKGILVELYEADGVTPAKIANKTEVEKSISDLSSTENSSPKLEESALRILRKHAEKIGDENHAFTDENGNYEFYGLDPGKNYIVKFTYNGMEYSEIKASADTGIDSGILSGYPNEDNSNNASKSTEINRENEITKYFREIGPHPQSYESKTLINNYNAQGKDKYNETFFQEEVDGRTGGNYGQCIKDIQSKIANDQLLEPIETFIMDTAITAKTGEIGGILENAEAKIKQDNADSARTNFGICYKEGQFVYPVVESNLKESINIATQKQNKIETIQTNIQELQKLVDEKCNESNCQGNHEFSTCNVGYKIRHIVKSKYKMCEHESKDGGINQYHKVVEKKIYKKMEMTKNCDFQELEASTCNFTDEDGEAHCHGYVGENRIFQNGIWELYTYTVKEGYSTQEDEEHNIRFAIFDNNTEPLLAKDENRDSNEDDGLITGTKWGWSSAGRDIKTIGTDLVCNISEENANGEPSHANLGVLYRPTLDLGLINDVLKAELEINKKFEVFEYDKRAANGGTFSFGVNEYDLSRGGKSNYDDYYGDLSTGSHKDNQVDVNEDSYIDYRQEEDIFHKLQIGNTDNGSANAGGYNYTDMSITLTYKIRLINQAGVTATIPEIIDYYDNHFTFVGAYLADENNKSDYDPLSTGSEAQYYSYTQDGRGIVSAPEGYNYRHILVNKELKSGESVYVYVVLQTSGDQLRTMLSGRLKEGSEGYSTENYAEIYGYKTDIGVLDIDSKPGNLTRPAKDSRLKNTTIKYEDDESKSPTYIIKNPGKERTIEGMLFEDVIDIDTKIGEPRQGDNKYNSNDKPVIGGVVQLLEVVQGSDEYKVRSQTLTDSGGKYRFGKIAPGDYIVRFYYGATYETILTTLSNGNINETEMIDAIYPIEKTLKLQNDKSYNGQDYENVESKDNSSNIHWCFIDDSTRYSDARDDKDRRYAVKNYANKLTNENAEVFNSYKDKNPNKGLVEKLKNNTWMRADTNKMSIEIENYKNYNTVYDKYTTTSSTSSTSSTNMYTVTNAADKKSEDYEYKVENVDFGIKERERAELQITKKVSYISIVDSAGEEITGGSAEDIQSGKVKYIKMVPNAEDKQGFADMEIDTELLSGATLKVTYEIIVTNNSEEGNTIKNIEVIDYVSNNLNYDPSYFTTGVEKNSQYRWETKTTENIQGYVNKKSLLEEEIGSTNKIDLSSYQTILMTDFGTLNPNESSKKYLTLEKNLSSAEESNFNYENQVEIVSSFNENGRSDYSSIYGNLDPLTYTSKQGNLRWDPIGETNENQEKHGFAQMETVKELEGNLNGDATAIRLAEKDSGNAEEVIITPPTGAKGIVFQTYHFILAFICLTTLAGTIILIKKYMELSEE